MNLFKYANLYISAILIHSSYIMWSHKITEYHLPAVLTLMSPICEEREKKQSRIIVQRQHWVKISTTT